MPVIHAFEESEGIEIWIDTEGSERDGTCIGVGATLDEAVADARQELQNALLQLSNVPTTSASKG